MVETNAESVINFAVPSRPILDKQSEKYKINAETPGILKGALDAFVESKGKDVECKISIDGKKLAYGFGRHLGDEDLGGFESSPTLNDRKIRSASELETTKELIDKLHKMDKCDFSQIDHECQVRLVNDLKEMIHILSSRIRDLRVSVQKKTNYLNHLMPKVAGPWSECKFAPAISYIKTQILKSNACINKMLQSIDEIGFHISVLNGVGIHYCRGIGANVPLESQGNYICLRKLDEDCLNQVPDKSLLCEVLKQRSVEWFDLRKKRCSNGEFNTQSSRGEYT